MRNYNPDDTDDVLCWMREHKFLGGPNKAQAIMRAQAAAARRDLLKATQQAEQKKTAEVADRLETQVTRFAEQQWGAKTLAGCGLKLAEEAGEVAGACVKIPEGRATEEDLKDEIGDVLIVLSQFATKLGVTLQELLERRFQFIQQRAAGNNP